MALSVAPVSVPATAAEPSSATSVQRVARHPLHYSPDSWLGIKSPIRLGPLDQLVLPFIPIAVVFVYRQPDDGPTELIPVPRLQRALCLLLDSYPHLTGRLQLNATDATPEISQLGSGAELLEALCTTRLDDFIVPGLHLQVTSLPDGGNALLAPFDPSMEAVCASPLLTVQHTRFACGSVALGVRVLHTLCDADGFFQLVHDMCELYRGLCGSDSARLAQPPHTQSALANAGDMTVEERLQASHFQPSLFQLSPTVTAAEMATTATAASSLPSLPPPVVGRVLRFSAAELAGLKAHASDTASQTGWVSTFDALSAHLYQRVYVARLQHTRDCGADESALSTDFLTPVNCRRADWLHLPHKYFPNAVLCHYFTLPATTLATAHLSQVASAVHECVRQLSSEECVNTVRWLAAQPDKSRVCQGFRYANGGFMLSAWNKIDMRDGLTLDVDAQQRTIEPCLVQPPFTPISLMDGLGYLLPVPTQGSGAGSTGDVGVCLALAEPLWTLLDRDPLFRQFGLQSVNGTT